MARENPRAERAQRRRGKRLAQDREEKKSFLSQLMRLSFCGKGSCRRSEIDRSDCLSDPLKKRREGSKDGLKLVPDCKGLSTECGTWASQWDRLLNILPSPWPACLAAYAKRRGAIGKSPRSAIWARRSGGYPMSKKKHPQGMRLAQKKSCRGATGE